MAQLPKEGFTTSSRMDSAQTSSDNNEGDRQEATLREMAPSWFWRVGLAALLISIPIAFLVIVIMVGYLNRKKESGFGNNVLEVLQIASTLWPISFAAVIGPFLKTVALFWAEKGSTLGSLEFLMTSQTTAMAIKNFFILRTSHIWPVGVVVMWLLSPVGGQAAVRSLHLRPNTTSFDLPAIYYLGSNISDLNLFYNDTGDTGIFSGADTELELIIDMRSAISASFATPDILASHANGSSTGFDNVVQALGGRYEASRAGQRDLWNNVRIPYLELLPQYNKGNTSSWVPVPDDMVVPYASFIGVPIRGGSKTQAGNSTLQVYTHYQTLSCSAEFNGTRWLKPGSDRLFLHNTSSSEYLFLQYEGLAPNGAKPNVFFDFVNDTKTIKEHLSSMEYPITNVEPSTKLQLIVGGRCPGLTYMLRTCDISTTYVDLEVNCTRSTASDDLECQAVNVRHTPGFPINGNLTALSNLRMAPGIAWEMPFTTASYHSLEPSILETYLRDPTLSFRRLDNGLDLDSAPACFSNVSLDALEARLTTALNTFIMATYNTTVLTGADGTSLVDRNAMWQDSTGTWSEFTTSVYKLDKGWYPVFVISTVILLACALANVIIRQRIKAPDFMDSVTAMTRDSPFLEAPQVGSGASGFKRLQKMKTTRVRIRDIEPDGTVGRIALATDVKGPQLDWTRTYK